MADDPIKSMQERNEQEAEEEVEEVSLCDFALNLSDNDECPSPTAYHRRSSSSQSQPSDFFEFYNGHLISADSTAPAMSHAEDIISCGVLVPYNNNAARPLLDDRILNSFTTGEEDDAAAHLSRRYCESLPELKSSGCVASSSDILMMRSSRSLDCEKRRRNSNLVMRPDIRRSFSRDSVRSEGFVNRGPKPRWYNSLAFGNVKFPPEIELRDMKNRQFRRNPGGIATAVDGGGGTPANRRSSWGDDLLRLLSCRSDASVTVKAPDSLRSHVLQVHGAQRPGASSQLTTWTPYC